MSVFKQNFDVIKWILTLIFFAGTVWASILSIPKLDARVKSLEECQASATTKMAVMDTKWDEILRRLGSIERKLDK